MKPTAVMLLATVAFVGATGVVGAANGQTGVPPWPGNETTTGNESVGNDTTGVSPGQQLAGAVGAQGASVQGELWNRTLSERLANATTAAERAEVITDEVAMLESYLESLEGVRENVTEAWEDDEIPEGQYRATLSGYVVRAYTVERRANQTARAAERLPVGVRERHDVNVTYIRNLAERAHELHQFEGPIAREVANETLSNQSALIGVPPEGQRTNSTRTGQ